MSDDDTFMNKDKRQKPVRQVKLDEWLEDPSFFDTSEFKDNIKRNEQLIDLDHIPAELEKQIKAQFARLRPALGPADVIIASNPGVAKYYLGRVDGIFRERIVEGQFVPFEHPRDEYFGAQIIDTEEELEAFTEAPQRVWVTLDYKILKHSSPRLVAYVRDEFYPYFTHESLSVYTNLPD